MRSPSPSLSRPRSWLGARLAIAVAGAALLVLAATLGFAMSRGVGGQRLGETDAGFAVANDFTLPLFDGGSFTLSDYAGGPVFVYFWASWCAPCFREAPLIQRLWPEYRDAGYAFLGVNIQDREQDARAFSERFALTFPLATDAVGDVYLDYGVYGLPESFFIRPGLEVSRKFIGELTEPDFRSMLDRLVAAQ